MKSKASQKGIALVIVLWVVVLLSVIAGSFAFAMRTETVLATRTIALTKARSLAHAALRIAVLDLMRPQTEQHWSHFGMAKEWQFEEATAHIAIIDQAGKVDLNRAKRDLMRALLTGAGMEQEETEALLDAMEDWRDADHSRRLNGAEDEDYEAANLPYSAKDAAFDSIEELQQVMGMTQPIYERIRNFITVFSKQTGINPALAPKGLLQLLPDLDAETLETYLEQRESNREEGQPAPTAPSLGAFASNARSGTYQIQVVATVPEGATLSVDIFVNTRPVADEPFTILTWREGFAPSKVKENEADEENEQ